jgi:hypothetical protein
MTVKKEYEFDLYNDTWSGAQDRMKDLTDDLRDELIGILESDPEGIFGEEIPEETSVNDFLWFEDDTYAEWLGFDSADIMWKYCDLINNGVDEDEIYTDGDILMTESELFAAYELYQSENPDWEEDYPDISDWVMDNGYEQFNRG